MKQKSTRQRPGNPRFLGGEDVKKHTLVLGAGMVGVGVAWHLRRQGREVTLIDRREPGSETSHGNAGLIQREAVQPDPFPRDLATLMRVLPNRSSDIRYRPGAMFREAGPLWQYWRHSAARAWQQIIPEYASLIQHCTQDHDTLIQAADAHHLIRRRGWLQLYRTDAVMQQDLHTAAINHERYGVGFKALDDRQLAELEPDLDQRLVGAIHWTNAWSVSDPGALVKAYADDFIARGGTVCRAEATAVAPGDDGRWHIQTEGRVFEGDELVLATGPWTPEWLAPLGYRMPMFAMRGYHMHYDTEGDVRLNHDIADQERGYVLTPKKAGLRLTTGAELNTLGAPPRHGQLARAERVSREIFPLGQRRDAMPWLGNRPCMADMKPVIGAAHRHDNLWFAFGHGHQGFTLGLTTGRLLAAAMTGQESDVDMAPFASDRFA